MDIEKLRGRIEDLSEKVHMAWYAEKAKQGFHPPMQCSKRPKVYLRPAPPLQKRSDGSWPEEVQAYLFTKNCDKCHPDMYAYRHLPENIKEYDRVTVRSVLDAIGELEG